MKVVLVQMAAEDIEVSKVVPTVETLLWNPYLPRTDNLSQIYLSVVFCYSFWDCRLYDFWNCYSVETFVEVDSEINLFASRLLFFSSNSTHLCVRLSWWIIFCLSMLSILLNAARVLLIRYFTSSGRSLYPSVCLIFPMTVLYIFTIS